MVLGFPMVAALFALMELFFKMVEFLLEVNILGFPVMTFLLIFV
jgi:hypothetical protein